MNRYFLYFFLVLLSGCVTEGALPGLTGSGVNASVNGKGDFVELNNGTIIGGTISHIGSSSVTINGKKMPENDFRAFQYESEYKAKFRSYFVTRVVKGNINLYSRVIDHSRPGSRVGKMTYYFLQKGEGPIVYFDVPTLEKMVQDYGPALKWIEEYRKLKKKDDSYLDKAIETYNLK